MAIVVAVGGLMGYMKRGSKISLVAGGGSAALFYYVYKELPGNPVLASSIGIGNGFSFYSAITLLSVCNLGEQMNFHSWQIFN